MRVLDDVVLRAGAHTSPEDDMCLMEAVAFFAGERHSDRPLCACPILGEFGRGLNDCLPGES